MTLLWPKSWNGSWITQSKSQSSFSCLQGLREVATCLSSSYGPLSLCSSHTNLLAIPRSCEAGLHFRNSELAVLTLRMLFLLIAIWLTPSSVCSKVPFKISLFWPSNCQLSQFPILCSIFLPGTKRASHTKSLWVYYLFNMFIVCNLTPTTYILEYKHLKGKDLFQRRRHTANWKIC